MTPPENSTVAQEHWEKSPALHTPCYGQGKACGRWKLLEQIATAKSKAGKFITKLTTTQPVIVNRKKEPAYL